MSEIGLPHLVGLLGGKGDIGRFRFLLRLRDDQPGPFNVRQIVATDTVSWCWARCQAMVCGPASKPCPASSPRRPMINSTIAAEIGRTVNSAARIAEYARPGEVLGSEEVVYAA